MNSPLLPMDYYDRNGKKWSVEKGDWLSHQAEERKNKTPDLSKLFNKKTKILLLVILIIITGFVSFF
jgi:hypothetical protein